VAERHSSAFGCVANPFNLSLTSLALSSHVRRGRLSTVFVQCVQFAGYLEICLFSEVFVVYRSAPKLPEMQATKHAQCSVSNPFIYVLVS
jgi:hypothetical protein